MDKIDNNIIAVICYVFSNIVVTAYIYFMKKFNVEKFKALQVLQENILEIVSQQPSSARTEILQLTPHAPYPSPSRAVEIEQHRDIDLGNGKILRIHSN